MRAFKQFPVIQVATSNLSKEAEIRVLWFDWYFSHGDNAEATCRHFGISKSVFYRWKNRFNPHQLQTLEFDSKTRRPKPLRTMSTDPGVLKRIYEIRLS